MFAKNESQINCPETKLYEIAQMHSITVTLVESFSNALETAFSNTAHIHTRNSRAFPLPPTDDDFHNASMIPKAKS